MKKIIIVLGIFANGFLYAQKNNDSLSFKTDSIKTIEVRDNILRFAQQKNIGINDFIFLQKIFEAYIDERRKYDR